MFFDLEIKISCDIVLLFMTFKANSVFKGFRLYHPFYTHILLVKT